MNTRGMALTGCVVALDALTQSSSGRARCFCGADIDIKGTRAHVHAAHMTDPHHA
jgi:hypothetical protein